MMLITGPTDTLLESEALHVYAAWRNKNWRMHGNKDVVYKCT